MAPEAAYAALTPTEEDEIMAHHAELLLQHGRSRDSFDPMLLASRGDTIANLLNSPLKQSEAEQF